MMRSITSDKHRGRVRLWAVCFWLIVWQLLAMAVSQEILLASPLNVLKRLCALAVTAEFWQTIAFSLWRILGGFLLGCLAGAALAAPVSYTHLASTLKVLSTYRRRLPMIQ